MRTAKEIVVNLTVNEFIRTRLSKIRRFLLSFRKKIWDSVWSLYRVQPEDTLKKYVKYNLKIRNEINRWEKEK